MTDLAAVLVALGLLMGLAYRGVTLLIAAPATALLAALLTGGLPILGAYTQIFMSNTGSFIVSFFPLFMLGAIFGKLMDDSGSARSLARLVSARLGPERAVVAVVLCCAVLTYGGVSAFVVAFAIYPVAAALFRNAGIPKRLIPGALALGAFTFTMSALPGSPAIQNAIPMPFLGTTAFAAPALGIVSGLVMFALGVLWLNGRAARAQAAGEGYGHHVDSAPTLDRATRERAQCEGFDIVELSPGPNVEDRLPPATLAVLPIAVVIVSNFLFIQLVVPRMDTAFLAEPKFGATTIETVRGVWAVIVSLSVAILLLIAGNWRRLDDLRTSLDQGADASVLPIFNTASLVGFGAVIAALPVFGTISDAVLTLGGGNPLVSVAASVSVLSAMTGSASGGMSIALDALGPTFVDMARTTGVSLDVMHRVTAVASGALDALPHNGAVITLLTVCRLSHRDAYGDVFIVAAAIPMVALVVLIVLAGLLRSFGF
ncbi:GntP family permease [Azospirillum canadense]|uniref:GntP family permease n=1 Tax=Azospirillum canadense TaxID=403962 RepID=UPI002227E105|nr:GntP family permease [Azospirillum canadense]MCW2242729.1 H+/gluconate symporter-like permease [Azospirillum canadense]